MSFSRPRRRAFTLLELLLAIGMAAMVMLTLYMALTIGLRGRDTVSTAIEPVRAANLAMELARADLESLIPPTGSQIAGPFVGVTNSTQRGGAASTIRFFSVGGGTSWIIPKADGTGPALPAGGGGGLTGGRGGLIGGGSNTGQDPLDEGAHEIEISLVTDVNPPVLVRRVYRDVLNPIQSDTDPNNAEQEILARNVRSFSVRFYSPDYEDWQTEWNSDDLDNQIPTAVELTLEIEYLKRGATEPSVYKVVRIVPLAVAKPSADTTGGAQ